MRAFQSTLHRKVETNAPTELCMLYWACFMILVVLPSFDSVLTHFQAHVHPEETPSMEPQGTFSKVSRDVQQDLETTVVESTTVALSPPDEEEDINIANILPPTPKKRTLSLEGPSKKAALSSEPKGKKTKKSSSLPDPPRTSPLSTPKPLTLPQTTSLSVEPSELKSTLLFPAPEPISSQSWVLSSPAGTLLSKEKQEYVCSLQYQKPTEEIPQGSTLISIKQNNVLLWKDRLEGQVYSTYSTHSLLFLCTMSSQLYVLNEKGRWLGPPITLSCTLYRIVENQVHHLRCLQQNEEEGFNLFLLFCNGDWVIWKVSPTHQLKKVKSGTIASLYQTMNRMMSIQSLEVEYQDFKLFLHLNRYQEHAKVLMYDEELEEWRDLSLSLHQHHVYHSESTHTIEEHYQKALLSVHQEVYFCSQRTTKLVLHPLLFGDTTVLLVVQV